MSKKQQTTEAAKPQGAAAQSTEKTLVVLLLDRTGSMSSVKQETIGGFNGYLSTLAEKPETAGVTVHFTQFDTVSTDVVHDFVPLADVKKLTDGEENSSAEWTLDGVKAIIKEKEDKDKWTFSYIGVGPAAWQANARLSHGTQGASNVLRATAANAGAVYSHLAGATSMRCCTVAGTSLNSVYGGAQLDQDDQNTKKKA